MEDTRKLNMRMKDAEDDSSLIVNPLQNMNLMDDFLFDVATVDLETCKIIIELSLGITIKKIRWKEGQKVIHNMPGKRGIRMDFYVEDDKGQVFDVEMQKRNQGNIPKGTRFYQALIDTPMLKSGERGFDNLKPAYIIVICGFDQYGYGKYRYTKENVPEDCDERLKHLHKKIYEIKSNEQMGVSYMKMEERDRLIQEEGERIGERKGEIKGEIKAIVSIVRRMLKNGYDINKAVDDFDLDKKYVKMAVDAISEYGDNKSDQEIAEMILYNEV